MKIQEELEAERDFIATIIQTTRALIVTLKKTGEIVSINNSFSEVSGYELKEVKGKIFYDIFLPESLREEEKKIIGELFGVKLQNVSKVPILTKNQQKRDIEWYNTKVIDKSGEIKWIIKTGIDLTERNILEEQLLRSKKLEAIGTLSIGIAHDFNNILQAILCYTQSFSRDYGKDSEEHFKLTKIEECVKRASELTRQLLTFGSRIEPKKRRVGINGEIRAARKFLARTIPKMVDIKLELAEGLDRIMADPNQIQQIIVNLCVNSNDALTDGGTIVIKTENVNILENHNDIHPDASPGDYIKLTVTDNGTGMENEDLDHIFDPFFTTKEVGAGSGLGLAVVYGIVKNHGGFIKCGSEPGKGTEFNIFLPIAEPEEPAVQAKKDVKEMEPNGETILLVEDDDMLRQLGHDMLKLHGFEMITARNGEEALEIYNEKWKEVDLVILDLIMPGMGGKKCLGEMMKINNNAKVLVASGMAFDEPQKEVMEAGAIGFITKPYEMKEMVGIVKDAIDKGAVSG